MSCPGGFAADLPGTVAAAGPSAESVLVVAERLSGVARDLDALRLQLCGLDSVDWNSAAAAVFRKTLAESEAEFTAAGRRVESAVAELGSYGAHLRAAADSGAAANPDWPMNPGFTPAWGGPMGAGRGWPNF